MAAIRRSGAGPSLELVALLGLPAALDLPASLPAALPVVEKLTLRIKATPVLKLLVQATQVVVSLLFLMAVIVGGWLVFCSLLGSSEGKTDCKVAPTCNKAHVTLTPTGVFVEWPRLGSYR